VAKILIVEDDLAMGATLRDGIECEGHTATLATDGDAGLRLTREDRPDLVILDLTLPKTSGLDVCRRLREGRNQVPIIMLTSRSSEIDKIVGLKSGADDYMTKPFSFSELMARVDAVMRRSGRGPVRTERYAFGDIRVDFTTREITKAGNRLTLSAREYALLEYFIAHRGRVVGRDELLGAVWGLDEGSGVLTRTVDMHMAKLRQKIEDKPNDPRHIVTVRRVGYKFTG
jgi:two-component system alkaline phosphatase synthesis response regulator PhoP